MVESVPEMTEVVVTGTMIKRVNAETAEPITITKVDSLKAQGVENLEQASAYPSRAYRVNLDVLAMVALFTGGFLVFSAQALETARRRGEHALLRVLGLQRRGVARLVLLCLTAQP